MYDITMNKLSIEKRTQVIKALVDGNSIRATCRITDTAKGTVTRLLRDVGRACRVSGQGTKESIMSKGRM